MQGCSQQPVWKTGNMRKQPNSYEICTQAHNSYTQSSRFDLYKTDDHFVTTAETQRSQETAQHITPWRLIKWDLTHKYQKSCHINLCQKKMDFANFDKTKFCIITKLEIFTNFLLFWHFSVMEVKSRLKYRGTSSSHANSALSLG